MRTMIREDTLIRLADAIEAHHAGVSQRTAAFAEAVCRIAAVVPSVISALRERNTRQLVRLHFPLEDEILGPVTLWFLLDEASVGIQAVGPNNQRVWSRSISTRVDVLDAPRREGRLA